MEVGARNKITGKVTEIKKDGLMSQVKVEIPVESTLTSVMTVDSLEGLGIKEGDEVRVIAKAVNVLLIKE